MLWTLLASPALAAEGGAATDVDDGKQEIQLGLDPGTPSVGALPGGLTPAYGQRSLDEGEWRFDFHGFLTMPLRMGLNTRAGAVTTQQHNDVLHAPPVVPDYADSFNYTTIVPQPYAQLNFSYGNSVVTGNVIILSHTATDAQQAYDPTQQSGIADAYVTFHLPELSRHLRLDINVGAFSSRYGVMGEYDLGKYGTPVIGQVNGVGEGAILKLGAGDLILALEEGFEGQFDKFPNDVLPAGWNGFASPNVGSGFVAHLHAGLSYMGTITVGLHYLYAWTQDDRAAQGTTPDSKMTVAGADVRLTTGNIGHVYLGVSHTKAVFVGALGSILEVMNDTDGISLINNFLGPASGGNGTLTTVAGQWDISVGNILKYPQIFTGDSPDVVVSLFAMDTRVTSNDAAYNDVNKLKFGGEGGVSLFKHLAASFRFDRVMPNGGDASQAFSIASPRLIFRSKWQAHDQVVLQYSRFFYGDGVVVRNGDPAVLDPTIHADRNMISLSATMWW